MNSRLEIIGTCATCGAPLLLGLWRFGSITLQKACDCDGDYDMRIPAKRYVAILNVLRTQRGEPPVPEEERAAILETATKEDTP